MLPLTCTCCSVLKVQTMVQSSVAPNFAHPTVNLLCVVEVNVCSIERRMMRTHMQMHMHSFPGDCQRGTGRRIRKRTRNTKVKTSARSSAATLHAHKRARQSESTDVSIHQCTASRNKLKPSTHQTCTVLTLDRESLVIKLRRHV